MTDDHLTLQLPVDATQALAETLDWLRATDWTDEFGALVLRPLEASSEPNSLSEHFAMVGLCDWRDAIISAVEPGQQQHLEPKLTWLMSQTAIQIALGPYKPGHFQLVEQLQMLGEISDAQLASAFCSHLANVPEDHPIVDLLRVRLNELWNSPFNERLRHYVETTGTGPLTTRGLWPAHSHLPVGDGWAHRIAATLWPDRYMELLAGFPAPFQYGFGDVLSLLELNLVASLIGASPNVFSSDGAPLGPVVVFALLDTLESKLASVADHSTATAETELSKILDTMFSRSDGEWIGRAWLQQIIWRDTPRRAGRTQDEVVAQRNIRDTLLVQLSGRITPLGDAVFDWVLQEEPLWRVHRVLSEASILEAQGDTATAAKVLAESVKRGLVSATGRSAGLITGSPEANIVARVLSRLPDSKLWFENLWRDTYELREHLSYQEHRDLDNPAYPALVWGLIGLNSSQITSPDAVAGFWRAIGNAVFETQLIDPNATLVNGAIPPITRVAVQLGAALVERGILQVSDFASFLADQLEPTTEHAHLWEIARSEASDSVTLNAGRLVGAIRLRLALEAGLAQKQPGWGIVLSRPVRDDLVDFLNRL